MFNRPIFPELLQVRTHPQSNTFWDCWSNRVQNRPSLSPNQRCQTTVTVIILVILLYHYRCNKRLHSFSYFLVQKLATNSWQKTNELVGSCNTTKSTVTKVGEETIQGKTTITRKTKHHDTRPDEEQRYWVKYKLRTKEQNRAADATAAVVGSQRSHKEPFGLLVWDLTGQLPFQSLNQHGQGN